MRKPELIIEDMLPQGRLIRATEKDLRELADDIHTNGLRQPILIMDGIVVDGLKRIEAFKLLGRARIPAIIPTHFGEAVFLLEKTHKESGDVPVYRAVELSQDLEPFRQKYVRAGWGLRNNITKQSGPWVGVSSRSLMAKAVGCSESFSDTLTMILKRSAEPDVAKRIEEIKNGTETVHPTWAWIKRRQELSASPAVSPEEARMTIGRGINTLDTTLAAMGKFGPITVLTLQERSSIVGQLEKHRASVTRLLREIREGIASEKREMSNG